MLGVFLITTVLSGCGQSKKEVSKNDDHLTVYLWENRLMKNIAPYIRKQFLDQDIEFITSNNDTDLYSYFEEHGKLPDIITVRRFSGGADTSMFQIRSRKNIICYFQKCIFPRCFWEISDRGRQYESPRYLPAILYF